MSAAIGGHAGLGMQGSTERLEPVRDDERIHAIDVIRGFALIGIVLMNIEWFNRPTALLFQYDWSLHGADYAAGWLVHVLVDGRFIRLFSLLFGMGFAVMLTRAMQAGRPFTAVFLRRMAALMVFGLIHLTLLWQGDILHDYAFNGLLLLGVVALSRRRRFTWLARPSALLKLSLAWLVLPVVVITVTGIGFGVSHGPDQLRGSWQDSLRVQAAVDQRVKHPEVAPAHTDNAALPPALASQVAERATSERDRARLAAAEQTALSKGGFLTATAFRMRQAMHELKIMPLSVMELLPIFLLGYWLVMTGRMREPGRHAGFHRTLAWVGMGIGLPLGVGATLIMSHPVVSHVRELSTLGVAMMYFSQLLMTAGYLGVLNVVIQSARGRRWVMWMAPMGRMALTNYLGQSLILSLVFYGYGLGQFGHIPRGPQMLMVAAIIAFQAIFSAWWLRHFRFGPLEWLWRCATYWRWQPFRSARVAAEPRPGSFRPA